MSSKPPYSLRRRHALRDARVNMWTLTSPDGDVGFRGRGNRAFDRVVKQQKTLSPSLR